MRRRFEFQEGGSNKFWEIELAGTTVTTWWGKMGTAGQTKTKDFGSEAKAQHEYEKLVQEKLGKGYKEVHSGESDNSLDSEQPSKLKFKIIDCGDDDDDEGATQFEIDYDDQTTCAWFEQHGLDANGHGTSVFVDYIARTKLPKIYDEFSFSPEADNLLVTCEQKKHMAQLVSAFRKVIGNQTQADEVIAIAAREHLEEETVIAQEQDAKARKAEEFAEAGNQFLTGQLSADGFLLTAQFPDGTFICFKKGPFDVNFTIERSNTKLFVEANCLTVEINGEQQKLKPSKRTISRTRAKLEEVHYANGMTIFCESGRPPLNTPRGIRIPGPNGLSFWFISPDRLQYYVGHISYPEMSFQPL